MELLGQRIAVKKVEKDSKIILPDKVMVEDIIEGEIVAIGNKITEGSGCEVLNVGDMIQWSAFAGTWTKIEGQVVCILRMNDIVCRLAKIPDLAVMN